MPTDQLTQPHRNTVRVEVYCFNLDTWTGYSFVGSRPGATLVEADNGIQGWFVNSLVRYPASELREQS